MYARPAVRQRAPTAQLKDFPAPIGGWVANRNLAQPAGNGLPQGAAILDNFFPLATTVILRRGSELYATLGAGTADVLSLFSYNVGSQKELYAATADTITEITTITYPESAFIGDGEGNELGDGLGNVFGFDDPPLSANVMTGLTGGHWITVQFEVTGNIYLVGVNGVDFGFIYDGTTFYPNVPGGIDTLAYDGGTVAFTVGETLTGGTSGATAIIVKVIGDTTSGTLWLKTVTSGPFQDNEAVTDGDGGAAVANGANVDAAPGMTFSGSKTSADMSFVWAYQNRLFFIEKDTLTAHYLPVDSVGGTATALPLGGTFNRGGLLLFGQAWSLGSGNSGGLSDQCIFATTEGEVAVFQGIDPSDANAWSKVGVYRIGKPLGDKAFIRAGGDLVISTSIGFIPLSQAIQKDVAALSPSAVSYNIEEAWNEALKTRGFESWHTVIWPESQMVLVAPPTATDTEPAIFAVNARTGAWARFTGWHAHCMEVFNGELYYGSSDGRIVKCGIGGTDEGASYTGTYAPLFEDFGNPSALKIGQLGRAVLRASTRLATKVVLLKEFSTVMPAAPQASLVSVGSEWGVGVWGESVWGAGRNSTMTQDWKSLAGQGYALSIGTMVTSGSDVPLDVEIVRVEATFQTADILS